MSEQQKTGIGIVGAGVISKIYLQNLNTVFKNTRVIGVADIIPEAAQARAEEFGVLALTVDELIAHPEVEIVLNLTIPAVHAEIAAKAIALGKSAYNEKPLATERADGQRLLIAAKEKGVLVGAAPDTFLGGGLQTVRKAIDDGLIGTPIGVDAHMLNHGMEAWHPNPFFFFQPGAGPMFDVGVYYITAMAAILGPFKSVAAQASVSFPERTVGIGPKAGDKVPVNTPTYISGAIAFESGVIGTMTASFDVYETQNAWLTIYGTEGTLRLPDPNTFGGPVQLLRAGQREWEDVPVTFDFTVDSRGLGISDFARARKEGYTPRASGEMAYHVLDTMHAFLDSAASGQRVEVESTFERPALRAEQFES
ncbi:MAG: Gfo/Idh/MocA family oxidoreductase [Thermomicrobiales bacterium]